MEQYPVFLQWFLRNSCNQRSPTTYNHCLYTVQTVLNFAAGSFCCKMSIYLDCMAKEGEHNFKIVQ